MNWHRSDYGQELLYDDHFPVPRLIAAIGSMLGRPEAAIYDDTYHVINFRHFATAAEARAWAEAESQWIAMDRLR